MAPPKGALKGRPKTPQSGRKKGQPNKLTVEAREAFRLAAEGAGGVEALTEFAKTDPKSFWPLYARLIPVDVTSGGQPIKPSAVNIQLVKPSE
jgi:hypothetical protein